MHNVRPFSPLPGARRFRLSLILSLALLILAPVGLAAQPAPAPFRVTSYELVVELEPDVHRLRVRAHLQVAANQPLAVLTFYLNRNLKVQAVRGPDGKNLRFEQPSQTDAFQVDLREPLAADQTLAVQVDYAGVFDPALRSERGPVLARIAPGASYLLPESRWFPQSVNPWHRFEMKLTVTVPEGETVLSSGPTEAAGAAPLGKSRFLIRSTAPIRAGTLVVGRFEKAPETIGAPLTFYLRTVPTSYASTNAERLADIYTYFSDKFGALEPPGLAILEVPDDSWEAYAAPGLLLLPVRHWSNNINFRLLARTVAQQWWAARVLPAHAADVWLAYGLARYSEALYVEHSAGKDAFRQTMEDLTIAALVDESASPIANADRLAAYSPEFNSVVRDKGAMVFHMLRQVIGDKDFDRLLQTYAKRFAGRAASVDEFEELAEEVSGEPLDYFFGQWLRSTGVPQFELEYVTYRTQKGFRVSGTIKHELEIFRMPVQVRIETEGPPVTNTVQVAGLSSDFAIETFGKPQSIQIDPEFHVLKYTPDLRLRVSIARGESLFERNQYFEAIREYQSALEVKRNSSLAHYRLGEIFFEQRNYQSAANAFREAVNGDQEPKWTMVWSRISLGKIFDITGQRERAINEYRRAIESGDDTQGAQTEAEKYLREPYRRQRRTIKSIDQSGDR